MAKPNWPHWADPDMEFWTSEQAICLSLDIDPYQSIPGHLRAPYAERLHEMQGAIEAKSALLPMRNGKVRRFEFAFWALARKDWDVPDELRGIVGLPISEIGEPSQGPHAAEIHENRYRAVGEDARFALFNVAELAAWGSANKIAVPFLKLLITDEHTDIPPERRFQPCGTLPLLIAMAYVPVDMDPHDAQAELLASGVTADDGNPVGQLRDRIAVSYKRQLLNAVYDGKLTIYERTDYTPIDVTASRLRYEAQSEFDTPDGPRQPTGRKPVELVSPPLSSPVQFILHSGKYARASAGEIVLPADTTHMPVHVAIGLTVSAATIQFPNYVNVYEREGIDASDAGEVKFEHMDGRDEAERLAFRDFPAACVAIGIMPRNPYSPYADDYAGTPEQNVSYQLTVDELRKYAERYGVTVQIEGEPSASASEISKAPPILTIADWVARARELAQAIGLKKWNTGIRNISAREVASSVASELGKEPKYWGNQGPRGESNVRNEALRGWKFQPPDSMA